MQNSLGNPDSEAQLFSWKTLRKMHGFTRVSNMSKGNVLFVPFKEKQQHDHLINIVCNDLIGFIALCILILARDLSIF